MTERELLEFAAKAAGYEFLWNMDSLLIRGVDGHWNPLTDDGDALRLAVKIGMTLHIDTDNRFTSVPVYGEKDEDHVVVFERHGKDPLFATRRAITRAAAEIGRTTT